MYKCFAGKPRGAFADYVDAEAMRPLASGVSGSTTQSAGWGLAAAGNRELKNIKGLSDGVYHCVPPEHNISW